MVTVLSIMLVNRSQSIVPLCVNRQIAEYVTLILIGVFQFKVQVKLVNSTKANNGNFIFGIDSGFGLN